MEYIIIPICFIISILITPLIKKLAFRINAVDLPNERKVHQKVMPRIGGLAIYISFIIGLFLYNPDSSVLWPLFIGGTIIMIVGLIDDVFQISPLQKFIGQLLAVLTVMLSGIQIDFITIPFGARIELGLWGIPLTILWVLFVTNAINFIDGLDGLASGVSAIALTTISVMAITMGNMFIAIIGFMLLGSILGFLVYNFYPAKIFLGDTGSNFLGFMISILAILGLFKNVTVFSIIIPIVILGVPFVDTLFAVIRRITKRKPIYAPDKLHLHHCLLKLGYSHRQTVLLLYGMSAVFSLAAIIFTRTTLWGSVVLFVLLATLIELIVEITGLISQNYRPILNLINRRKNY
ncbi:MraY family glycosyltransferase [Salirhabdus sp. Marseille-P4669]|uniref:MraY family glycosyltransferase n=1 Tax=Salirhabdus sp. Marseille-P4669 TaxID=2042310 RepID=UPI000C7A1791|nr:MraY family glycosyltransferase [Salirhabdus sp. Marseille-P4669]